MPNDWPFTVTLANEERGAGNPRGGVSWRRLPDQRGILIVIVQVISNGGAFVGPFSFSGMRSLRPGRFVSWNRCNPSSALDVRLSCH
jgi:hypothetical protein